MSMDAILLIVVYRNSIPRNLAYVGWAKECNRVSNVFNSIGKCVGL